ncbi:MAG TPA: hypothetical protein VNJ70_07075 [Thermoanaerobaculia bacterium]|nr:hypothetical protein [Thermoanaerobaculia bacterium]
MPRILPPSELRDLFFQNVPEPVLMDTAKVAIGSYVEAFKYCCDNFPGPEAHDIYPQIRRVMFERNWRGRISRYPGVTLEAMPNAIDNCYHGELTAGRVVMTVSAVESPGKVVREAVFRTGLARDSQMNLYGEAAPPPAAAALYAILVHGPLGFMLPSPGFLHVAFPASDCDSYVDRFNLLDYFPVLRAELEGLPKLPERKEPRIRRDRDRKAE